MAIYTLINKSQLESILAFYNLGTLIDYSPITAGTINSNYLVCIENNNSIKKYYVLTIIEQDLSKSDIEFCNDFMQNLKENNINIAAPINDRKSFFYRKFFDKFYIISPFIQGQSYIAINNEVLVSHCKSIGEVLANMHMVSYEYNNKINFNTSLIKPNINPRINPRINPEGLTWCQNTAKILEQYLDHDTQTSLNIELNYLDKNYNNIINILKNYLKHITGVVHADLFCDNVIFDNNKPYIIDFFCSCVDFYLYDLAIVINDWVFEGENKTNNNYNINFNQDKYSVLISSYFNLLRTNNDLYKHIKHSLLETSNKNHNLFNILLRVAALRFWLGRLDSFYIGKDSDNKTIKNPLEYELKLLWHRDNQLELNDFL